MFEVGDLVFVSSSETIYRVEKILRNYVDERLKKQWPNYYPSHLNIGDEVAPDLQICPVYSSRQKKVKVKKKARLILRRSIECKPVTKQSIDSKISDLKNRIIQWEAIKSDTGVN